MAPTGEPIGLALSGISAETLSGIVLIGYTQNADLRPTVPDCQGQDGGLSPPDGQIRVKVRVIAGDGLGTPNGYSSPP